MSSVNGSLNCERGKGLAAEQRGSPLVRHPQSSRYSFPALSILPGDVPPKPEPFLSWMGIEQGEGLLDIVEETSESSSMVGDEGQRPRAFVNTSHEAEEQSGLSSEELRLSQRNRIVMNATHRTTGHEIVPSAASDVQRMRAAGVPNPILQGMPRGRGRGRLDLRTPGYVQPPRSGVLVPVLGPSEHASGTSNSPAYGSARSSVSSIYFSARSSASSAYLSTRSSISPEYVSTRVMDTSGPLDIRMRGTSGHHDVGFADLPLFTADARLDTRALADALPGESDKSIHRRSSNLYRRRPKQSPGKGPGVTDCSFPEGWDLGRIAANSKNMRDNEPASALLQRLRNLSILRRDDFASCLEPWALGSLCTWLRGIFDVDSNFAYEELVLALTTLFLCKSLFLDTSKALDCGSVVAWRLRTADPPIFSVTGDDICKWVIPLEAPCGIIPALTGGGCYSPRIHASSAASSPVWRCYSPHCSNVTNWQPLNADMSSKPYQFPYTKRSPGLSDWHRLLRAMDLLPPLDAELNWSGRGQHAEFQKAEHIPLRVERALGHGTSALVESVMCRRIRLARKRVRCSWRLKREDAIKEVAHLQRAQHAHILRVVGTYIIEKSRDLYILMYPVAECNLSDFMDDEDDVFLGETLLSFFPCLANTLAFLHEKHHIKHMDIKPENVLVRDIRNTVAKHRNHPYKVYLADFGISRSYASLEESETNSATSFTPLYAAPEVVSQDTRGFKAGVFSLGCVFTEMVAAIHFRRGKLADIREQSGCRAFHANIPAVQWFLHDDFQDVTLLHYSPIILCIRMMISEYPDDRPPAADVRDFLGKNGFICDEELPEAFEVAPPLSEC